MSCSYVPNSREKTFGKETHHRHAHSHSHHWHAHGWHTGHTCGQSLKPWRLNGGLRLKKGIHQSLILGCLIYQVFAFPPFHTVRGHQKLRQKHVVFLLVSVLICSMPLHVAAAPVFMKQFANMGLHACVYRRLPVSPIAPSQINILSEQLPTKSRNAAPPGAVGTPGIPTLTMIVHHGKHICHSFCLVPRSPH